jgi:2-dehydropantoate 2-reductase
MRTLIVGAGATGGYFGARLLAAGRDVTFLVRPRTARQLAEHGLRVISAFRGDVVIDHPPTVLAEDIRGPYNLILLSCKAYDLDNAMDSIASAVAPGTAILPMLNGMAHMEALDKRFGREQVLGGTCFISSARDADGTIRHLNDRDEIFFGDRFEPASERMQAVAATLGDANFLAQLRPVILHDMWQKWSFLATLAGATCLMRASVGDIVAVDPKFTLRLFAECTAIAGQEGYPPTQAFIERQGTLMTQPGSGFTASMLRDLEDGAPIEAQQILGDLLDHARRHQIATPLLEIACTHVRCYEERRKRENKA